MKSQASRVKLYSIAALALAVVAAMLYTFCYLFASDGSGYFIQGHHLPLLANSLSIISVCWFANVLILIPKGALPTDDFMIATGKPFAVAAAPLIGTLAAGAVCFTYYEPADLIAVLKQQRPIDVTIICSVLAVVGAVLCGVYYVFRMINVPNLNNACVILGLGPVALLTGLCGLTYFELDHYMNVPSKIGFQLAWIATMLFLTSELRCTLDKAQPRRYLASAGLALFANACACAPALYVLMHMTDSVHNTRILGFALLCLGNCIYIGYRLFQFASFCKSHVQPDPSTPLTVPEQTQGKDDQDGCQ
ncbi:MAG: hypothetical protein IJW70_07745 [Clostridia bacterium]|nr:hypothetical protein [Clostridia bacterium]